VSTEDALAAPIKDTTNEHLHWGAGDLEGLHTAQAHRVAASAANPAPAELPPVTSTGCALRTPIGSRRVTSPLRSDGPATSAAPARATTRPGSCPALAASRGG